MKTEDEIKEYVELVKRQEQILDGFSLEDMIELFFALDEEGYVRERP